MRIIITFNNESRSGFKSGWGFSCLVESKEKILFDTGCNGPALIYNCKKLNIDIKKISKLVVSHEHWDHTGGLFDILKLNNNIKVYVLESFSENIKNKIKKRATLIEVKEKQKISDNIHTTGLIKNNPDEQSLLVKTKKGILVIVGCSHPGVDRILEIAKTQGKIYGIIGGFHGFNNFDALKNLELIGACHCTKYKDEIKTLFPAQFKEIKAGDVIEIK